MISSYVAAVQYQRRSRSSEIQAVAFLLLSLGLILSAIGIAVAQIYLFLQSGQWTSLSVIELAQMVLSPGSFPWAFYPAEWIGLWKILNSIPSSLAVLLVGMGCFFLGTL